jgi:ribosomal protein S18 acetylase RimI-like enzyme
MTLDEIQIRTVLKPGDLGFVIYRHGKIYHQEYQFGIAFESYIASGLSEFYKNYDQEKDCVWVCEYNETIIGFMLLMHRLNNDAQLRFFYLEKEFRGIGLGKKLIGLFMNFLKEKKYDSAYLWTTSGLPEAASLYEKNGFVLTEEKESEAFGKKLMELKYVFRDRN